jgi:hypothetical protein
LRYALDARVQANRKAQVKELEGYFPAPTETTTLILRLDETPLPGERGKSRGSSLLDLLGRLLPRKYKSTAQGIRYELP